MVCRCPQEFYLNRTSGSCVPVRESCGYGSYASQPATPISDKQCTQCRKCPAGKFQTRAAECDGTRDYDPLIRYSEDGACQACSQCNPKTYLNPDSCNGWGNANINPEDTSQCIPCRFCPDMHIVKNQCPGTTTYDTQSCESCISYCSDNTYVNDNVCDGYHFADVGIIDPMDCAVCPRTCSSENFEVRVGGCTGKVSTVSAIVCKYEQTCVNILKCVF